MATRSFRGDAAAIAEVDSFTPANVGIADTFTLTLNGKAVNFVATTEVVADVTAGLTAAWLASTEPEHLTLTPSDQTTYMDLTAKTAGRPHEVTPTETDGDASDDQTLTKAEVTANQSPYDWNCIYNWTDDDTPDAADDVVLENSTSHVYYGLDQSAITVATLTVKQSHTGHVGLPEWNDTYDFTEFLATYLAIGATVCTIGEGDGTGSGRIKLDFGAVQTAVTVHNSGSRADSELPAIMLKGTHAANTLTVHRGDVGVAVLAGETAVIATLTMDYVTNLESDAKVVCGSGATLTTIVKSGGILAIESNVVTVTNSGGTATIKGTATVTTLNVEGGTVYCNSNGTITNLYVLGHVDFSRDMRALTVTNCYLYKGGKISDPHKRVTWTNGIDLVKCRIKDVELDLGSHITVTPSAI